MPPFFCVNLNVYKFLSGQFCIANLCISECTFILGSEETVFALVYSLQISVFFKKACFYLCNCLKCISGSVLMFNIDSAFCTQRLGNKTEFPRRPCSWASGCEHGLAVQMYLGFGSYTHTVLLCLVTSFVLKADICWCGYS